MSIDRSDYDSKCLATCEILSAYIADTFYNRLHNEAIEHMNRGSSTSVTSGYKNVILMYIEDIQKPEQLKKFVISLSRSYQNKTNFASLTLGDFVNNVTMHFVPQPIHSRMNDATKFKTMCMVILNVFTETAEFIGSSFIKHIIDEHNKDNAMLLKDRIVDLLLMERERLYSELLKKSTTQMISRDVAERMREKYQKDIQTAITHIKKLETAAAASNKLMVLYKHFKEKCDALNRQILDYSQQLEELKKANAELRRENELFKNAPADVNTASKLFDTIAEVGAGAETDSASEPKDDVDKFFGTFEPSTLDIESE